ncbi:hypothetical protein D3C87_351320 [compost metagenome]
MAFCFVTSCVEADGDDINEMKEMAKDISSHSFIYNLAKKEGIDEELTDMLGYKEWANNDGGKKSAKKLFVDDWGLSCHSSMYQGIPCFYVVHSAIEYVYIDEKDCGKVLQGEDIRDRQHQLSVLKDEADEVLDAINKTLPQNKKILADFVNEHRDTLLTNRIPVQGLICDNRGFSSMMSFAEKINNKLSQELQHNECGLHR